MTQDAPAGGPLDRYMSVLELLVAFPEALTLSDVSAMLDLPKTTAHRLLGGLKRSALVKGGAGGRTYQLGERLQRLLHAAAEDGWLALLARPHLKHLTDTSGEACYLTRLIGARVVVAVSQAPEVRWRSYVQPGIEMPPNAAATAKAIIAFQNERLIAEALVGPLPRLTIHTRTDPAAVREELAGVRRLGHARCIGEIDEGLAAIAVPVTQPNGQVLHALGMTGPLARIMDKGLVGRIEAMKRTATQLAAALSLGLKIKAPDRALPSAAAKVARASARRS